MTIPGVKQRAAEVLIAEIGVDMSVFPTPKHLASWAKVCPGNDQSAGKRRSGKTGKGNKWLRATLDRVRQRRRPNQELLPRRPIPAPTRPPRPLQSRHRGRPLDPDRRLAHAPDRRAVPRPRRRLLHPPKPRPAHQTPRPPTPSARTPRHAPPKTPGGRRLTGISLQVMSGPTWLRRASSFWREGALSLDAEAVAQTPEGSVSLCADHKPTIPRDIESVAHWAQWPGDGLTRGHPNGRL